jgi:hypothetical protein
VEAMKVVHPGLGCEAGVATPTSLKPEPRMNIHKNARLTPQGRLLMVLRVVEEGWKIADAAAAAGLSQRRAYNWLARYRVDGKIALQDQSSTPARYRNRAPSARDAEIEQLRRQRLTGDRIARQLALPRSTVGAVLAGLSLTPGVHPVSTRRVSGLTGSTPTRRLNFSSDSRKSCRRCPCALVFFR